MGRLTPSPYLLGRVGPGGVGGLLHYRLAIEIDARSAVFDRYAGNDYPRAAFHRIRRCGSDRSRAPVCLYRDCREVVAQDETLAVGHS
jgi:hypothetical protein